MLLLLLRVGGGEGWWWWWMGWVRRLIQRWWWWGAHACCRRGRLRTYRRRGSGGMITQILRIYIYVLTIVGYTVESVESGGIVKVQRWIVVVGANDLILVSASHIGGHDGCASCLYGTHRCRITMPSKGK